MSYIFNPKIKKQLLGDMKVELFMLDEMKLKDFLIRS